MSDNESIISFLIDKGVKKYNKKLNAKRNTKVFHPSALGHCKRQIFYDIKGEKGTEADPRGMRIFDNGHSAHTRLSKYFKEAGVLIAKDIPVKNELLNINGELDAIIEIEGEQILIDFKTMSKWRFLELKRGGEIKKEYIYQLTTYMYLKGLKKCYFVFECKDNQEILVRELLYDERIMNKIIKKINSINWHLKRAKTPARDHNVDTDWHCGYCAHRTLCRKEGE